MKKQNLVKIAGAIVVPIVATLSGCANTVHGFGHLAKGTGKAAKYLGEGTGALLNGLGDDAIDASSAQVKNSNTYNQKPRNSYER